MAAPIALAVGLFGVSPLVLVQAGSKALLVYPVAALLLFPIWLAMAERSSVAVESGSPYSMTGLGASWAQFAVGSLSLLGYLALASVVLDLAANHLSTQVQSQFGVSIQPLWWAALLLLIVALRVMTGGTAWTPARTILAWAALLVPVLVIVIGFLLRGDDLREFPEVEPVRYWLSSVSLLGAALWAIEPMLARRNELRRPGRAILVSLVAVGVGLTSIAALATDLVMRSPEIDLESWLRESAPGEMQAEVLILLALVFLCVVALVRACSSASRLTERMATDGFFPAWLAPSQEGDASTPAVSFFLLTTAFVSFLAPNRLTTSGTAALAFFVVTALVLFPWARTAESDLPQRRYPRLPLHPLVPTAAIAISIFLALLLPSPSLFIGGVWMLASAVVWIAYSSSHALRSPDSGVLVGAEETEAEASEYRVMVVALGDLDLGPLVRLAMPLAVRHQGHVVVVQIVEHSARAFPSQLRRHAEAVQRDLQHRVDEAYPEGPIQTVVRIAPTETSGVVAAASELDVGLIVLPWHADPENPMNAREEDLLEEVFRSTRRPLSVLRGEISEGPTSITVATAGGPHAPFGLEIALGLCPESESVELLTVVSSALPPARGDEILGRTLAETDSGDRVTLRAVSATKTAAGLLDASADRALLIVGATADRLLGRSLLGGVSAEVAMARSGATLVVKRGERRALFLLRRLWQLLSEPLPQLTVTERSEVFLSMRSAARADVDFYILILLSSALATFGLRQNSTAVIIGAMLVAPLMSPILALAHGLIQGHLQMIRRAALSTTQGVATAVGVSALIGILWPDAPPTQEMLSRGAPTLLDLAVAVTAGAAAAYGVSRKSVAASLPGVAIAVALVPPLCVAGHGLGDSEFTLAAGAFLLFLTNLAGIVLVGALVFLLLGFRPSSANRDERVKRGLLLSALAILLLAIPLGYQGRELHQLQTLEAILEAQLARQGTQGRAENLRVSKVEGVLTITGEIFLFGELDDTVLLKAQEELARRIGAPVQVDLTLVPAEHLTLAPIDPREKPPDGEEP